MNLLAHNKYHPESNFENIKNHQESFKIIIDTVAWEVSVPSL